MDIKGILNRRYRHSGFVYGKPRWARTPKDEPSIEVPVRERARSRGECSRCGERCPTYDHLGERLFEFIPFWGIMVFFVYAMRRVSCPVDGVVVERVPWAEGKQRTTTAYAWFLAS